MSRQAVPPVAKGARLAQAGAVLAVATVTAHAGNYGLNILLARWLTPAEFSDANLMVSMMAMVTALALGLQMITARSVGSHDVAGEPERCDRLIGRFQRWAWASGVVVAAILVIGAPQWRQLFHTESVWPFVSLGVGMPFYLAQAVGRGMLQGRLRFNRLAVTYLVEMVVRVTVAAGLLAVGGGVPGATAGLAASFIATWLCVRGVTPRGVAAPPSVRDLAQVRAYAGPVGVLLLAQIVITNGDILLAKHFLDPATAGTYAGVSLLGRATYFLSWSVATVVFPAAARRHAAGQRSDVLLRGGIYAVAAMGALCVLATSLFGDLLLRIFLGPNYQALAGPLTIFVLSTTLFAVSNLVANHDLAAGRFTQSWVLLAGAVLQTVLLLYWHDSPTEMIRAQLAAMVGLLALVTLCATARKRPETALVEGSTVR